MIALLIFAITIIAFGMLSRRMEGWLVSPQMAFLAVGFICGVDMLGLVELGQGSATFLILGEAALVLTLFTDAARIDISALRSSETLSSRMLLIGLPLTIAAGTAIAILLLTDLSFWEAAIVGTVLAPTDAGLGQAVVNSPRVPARIRQALNVESGLNDGIATPILFLFLALAEAEVENGSVGYWARFALEQIGLGLLVGIAIGFIGGWLVDRALRRGWMSNTFKWLILPAMALLAWVIADELGGNGFIAAFVGGAAVAWMTHGIAESVVEFSDTGGLVLDFAVFFIFGSVATTKIDNMSWEIVLYAVLSLTLVRLLPLAISLVGSGLDRFSVLFMGWFGPRGLASIVLGLIVLEETRSLPGLERISSVVSLTVILSVFAHGISTSPLINRYRRHMDSLGSEELAKKETAQMPTRSSAKPHVTSDRD